MNRVARLETLLARIQKRRGEPRVSAPTTASTTASTTTRSVEAPAVQPNPQPSRPRSLTPLQRAAQQAIPERKSPAFAPVPADSSPPPAPRTAPVSVRPVFTKPSEVPRADLAGPPPLPALSPAPAPAPAPQTIDAVKAAPPSAPIAAVVGQPAAPATFGQLVQRALSLRPKA